MKKLFTLQGSSSLYKSMLVLLIGLIAPAMKSQAQFIYCTPTYSTACTVGNGDYINGVVAIGTGTASISNWMTGCSGNPDNYTYYSTMTVDAQIGGSMFWAVANGPEPQTYKMWADWNQDGDFSDPGEDIYTSATPIPANDSATGTILVPTNATLGMTRLRIRSSWNASPATFDACSAEFYGETEDYNINVVAPASPCNGTPTAGTATASPNMLCGGGISILSLTGYTSGPGITIQWESTPSGAGTWTPIAGATDPYYTTYVYTTSEFRANVTCTNGGAMLSDLSNSATVTVNPASSCQDSVWPGDANYDYVVDNIDPLYVALGNGTSGTPRPSASISWYGQYCPDWAQSFLLGANYKNADCDGNGVIDTTDMAAISANYSLTHMKTHNYANAAKTSGLPDLYLDMTGINLVPGTTVNIPLKFGTSAVQAGNVYGIAAQINFIGFTPASAPTLSWPSGWMGNSNNTLHFSKAVSASSLDWTYARTDQTNASGFGTIGMLSVAVPSTAFGQVVLSLDNVTMIDAAGNPITAYNVIDDTSDIVTGVRSVATPVSYASIVPNPSANKASLDLILSKAAAVELKVMDVTGRTVWTSHQQLSSGEQSIALPSQDIAKGLYMLHLTTGDGGDGQVIKWIKQ